MKAGLVVMVLAMAAAFAAPAGAQVVVPVNALPEGTPGCDRQEGSPYYPSPETTCTWGPATCSESAYSADAYCGATVGSVTAACERDHRGGLGSYDTKRCGAEAEGTEVSRSCTDYEYHSSGTYCDTAAGDRTCSTDPGVAYGEAAGFSKCVDEIPAPVEREVVCGTEYERGDFYEIRRERDRCTASAAGVTVTCTTRDKRVSYYDGTHETEPKQCSATAGGTTVEAGCSDLDLGRAEDPCAPVAGASPIPVARSSAPAPRPAARLGRR